MAAVLYPHKAPKPRNPVIDVLQAGGELVRIYDPSKFGTRASTFRRNGPRERFDHHNYQRDGVAKNDAKHGVWYGALNFATSLVEVFGDTRVIEYGRRRVGIARLTRDVNVLNLAEGAMAAGTVAAIAGITSRKLSQSWSRHFYRHTRLFGELDGLWYEGAHNTGICVMLYERAKDAISCPEGSTSRLSDRRWRPEILDAMNRYNLYEV